MSMAWVRKYYGVSAKRGGRVRYTGEGRDEFGTIRSATNGRLNIQWDSLPHAYPVHPTWELEYLTATPADKA